MSHPKRTWAGLRNGSARRLSGKRRRTEGSAATAMQGEEVPIEVRQMRRAVHQFGLVGGEYYDSKEERLQQILDRLPADSGTTLIFAKNAQQASGVVERCKRKALLTAAKGRAERVKAVFDGAGDEESAKPWACGRCTLENAWMLEECSACGTRRGFFPKVSVVTMDEKASRTAQWTSSCQILINYDLPRSLSEYLRRLTAIDTVESFNPRFPRVVYTFLEEPQLKNRSAKDLVELLKTTQRYVPAAKKAEIDSALGLIDTTEEDEDWEEEEEDDEDWDDDDWEACDCAHCRGSILGSTSYHPLLEIPDFKHKDMSGIEVVRLPLKALEDFDKAVPFIAPRVSGHSCTLICLHCLNVHTPWDGWEQFFAPSELTGTMRVVLVLAEGVSWHEYPDCALLGAGGSAWIDVLDMDSMDRSDMLLERLVDHEVPQLDEGFHNGPPSWTMAGKGGPYKVFVGGLPQECTTEVLSDYFSTFGMLTDVVVMSDRGTGRSRGFGFVSFDTVEPVEQIMAMHKEHQIMGKWIDCKNATVEGTKGAGGGMGGMGGMGKGGAGASGGMKGAGKPGDWKCPNCGALVFGSKSECFKCGTPKPDSSYGATSYGGYAAIAPPSSCGGGCSGGGAGYGGGSYGGGAAAYGSVGGNIGGGGGWTGKGCLGLQRNPPMEPMARMASQERVTRPTERRFYGAGEVQPRRVAPRRTR